MSTLMMSDLLEDLSVEQQQILAGGQRGRDDDDEDDREDRRGDRRLRRCIRRCLRNN